MLYPASVSVLGWGSEGWHCGWWAERGKFGKCSHSGRVTGKLSPRVTDDLLCVCSCETGSAYTGCVVNGRIARAAS